MPLDYTLSLLKCSSCIQTFSTFTDLSNHHLDVHERPLARYAVLDLVERTRGQAEMAPPPSQEAVPPTSPDWSPHSNNPAVLSALQQFWRLCQTEGLSYQELAARLLLDRLGVSPDAPVAGCEAVVQEAVTRWRGMVPVHAPPARWMWGTAQGCPHEYAHAETPECPEAGCVPTGKALPHEP